MATLFQVPQFFDNNGIPLSGGHLYWSDAGTSTPKLTWKDEAEGTPHTLAFITLDANGRAPGGAIFIRGSYKLTVKNSDESATYVTIDNINEYDSFDLTGLTASIADLNSTTTVAQVVNTTPYSVLLADRGKTLMVNSTTADMIINLPSAITVGNTFKIWIKKIDKSTHKVDIIPFGAQTIDGGTVKTLFDYNDFVEVRSDGSNWFLGGEIERGTIRNLSGVSVLTLADQGCIFNCDTSAGSFNVTLPSCVTVGKGYSVGFKKTDSSVNQVTLVPAGSETIDDSVNYFIDVQYQFTRIKTDGNNWFVLDESGAANDATTGDVKATLNNSQNGWILMNDGTIGDAASGGTTRANADTRNLYILIWETVSNTWCQITTSAGAVTTRGASAINDFNAHKRLAIPKSLGRAIINFNKALTKVWEIGEYGGEEKHVLLVAELATHLHALPPFAFKTTISAGGVTVWSNNDAIGQNTANTGSSTAHNNIQPSVALYLLMKL
jgi:hypothetical protein